MNAGELDLNGNSPLADTQSFGTAEAKITSQVRKKRVVFGQSFKADSHWILDYQTAIFPGQFCNNKGLTDVSTIESIVKGLDDTGLLVQLLQKLCFTYQTNPHCTGVAILPSVVQTACHCVARPIYRLNPGKKYQGFIGLEVFNSFEDLTMVKIGALNLEDANAVTVVAEQFYVHEKCAENHGYITYDFGLIALRFPHLGHEYIPVAASYEEMLREKHYVESRELVCMIIGWGFTDMLESNGLIFYDTFHRSLHFGWHVIGNPYECYLNERTGKHFLDVFPNLTSYMDQATWICHKPFGRLRSVLVEGDSGGPVVIISYHELDSRISINEIRRGNGKNVALVQDSSLAPPARQPSSGTSATVFPSGVASAGNIQSADLLREFEDVLSRTTGSLTPPESPKSGHEINALLQPSIDPITNGGQNFIMLQGIASPSVAGEAELDQLMAETLRKNGAPSNGIVAQQIKDGFVLNSKNNSGRPWDSPSNSSSSDSGYDDPDWCPAKSDESPASVETVQSANSNKKLRLTSTEERRLRKKEQNKNAATRYRMRKKMEMEEIIAVLAHAAAPASAPGVKELPGAAERAAAPASTSSVPVTPASPLPTAALALDVVLVLQHQYLQHYQYLLQQLLSHQSLHQHHCQYFQ
ncbi:unnamed protein product [Nesidiocoris tenuis]|uniref:Peptidase S1 domain-containing protein n=1 Tax=Nesidiocoris tenuis TaxID=355587 RepID=A0A6H5HF82_9HEMI|nr:unnamed protein product [Nesidiocoris tenuis]